MRIHLHLSLAALSLVAFAAGAAPAFRSGRGLSRGRGAAQLADGAAPARIARAPAGRVGRARPDTVYVGKSFTNHTAPDNYWNIYIGDYLPGTNRHHERALDWDNTAGIQAADSLEGWWPYQREYNSTGGLTLTDDNRSWWALDFGNDGNYIIAQGPPRSARTASSATGTTIRERTPATPWAGRRSPARAPPGVACASTATSPSKTW